MPASAAAAASYRRYAFDRHFDTPLPPTAIADADAEAQPLEGEAAVPIEPPVYTERDMAALIEAAEQRGFAAGIEQGRRDGAAETEAAIEAKLADAAASLERRLAELAAAFDGVARAVEAQGASVIAALMRRLTPSLLDRDAEARIARVVADALATAHGASSLRVRVSPDLADAMRVQLGPLAGASGFAGALDIVPDAAIPHGGVAVEWDAGSVAFDPGAIERAVAALTADAAPSSSDLVENPE